MSVGVFFNKSVKMARNCVMSCLDLVLGDGEHATGVGKRGENGRLHLEPEKRLYSIAP